MILTSILISNFEFIVFYFIIDFYNMIFTIQVNTFIQKVELMQIENLFIFNTYCIDINNVNIFTEHFWKIDTKDQNK